MTATTTTGERKRARAGWRRGVRLASMPAVTPRTQTTEALAPLRVAGFRVLAGGYSINELGNWLGDIALAVLVYDQTGSPMATALLFMATRFVPALVAPALVARVEPLRPRVSLPLLYGLDAVVFAGLALIAAHSFSLALVVALGAVDGTVALAARALTRSTSAALLEPHGLLRRGNALFNIGFTAAGALGPAIAGVVVAGAGVSAALWAGAASLSPVALLIAGARSLPARGGPGGGWGGRPRGAVTKLCRRPLAPGRRAHRRWLGRAPARRDHIRPRSPAAGGPPLGAGRRAALLLRGRPDRSRLRQGDAERRRFGLRLAPGCMGRRDARRRLPVRERPARPYPDGDGRRHACDRRGVPGAGAGPLPGRRLRDLGGRRRGQRRPVDLSGPRRAGAHGVQDAGARPESARGDRRSPAGGRLL